MKALVTGASSGIGYDISKYLSSLGYDIIAVARNGKNLTKLKQELNTSTKIIVADLSIKKNCINLYNEIKKENIDILINNAGFGIFGEFCNTKLNKDIEMINTNIISVHILTKLFIRDMLKSNKGYILNVGSLAGFLPGPLMAEYYSSKAYVLRLTQAIHKELKIRKSNVSISVLCPGPVKTNFNKIADVKFSLKSLESEYVAKYAIDNMFKKKLIIIPGIRSKIAKLLSKISPDKLIISIVYNIQRKKR